MNYRQWKKNYKKKHGYNPPISEDKRKRAKIEARLTDFSIDETASRVFEGIAKGLASLCEAISNSFANAAESFKCKAEYFGRK